uniref:Uncharacterized protein n=1 Tax=Anguilla anguilla TaxID=7936 RepID=A0A0E9WRD7_ANGAN
MTYSTSYFLLAFIPARLKSALVKYILHAVVLTWFKNVNYIFEDMLSQPQIVCILCLERFCVSPFMRLDFCNLVGFTKF